MSARTSQNTRPVNLPDAILANDLGAAKVLPAYEMAKSGSVQAAAIVGKALVNESLLEKIRAIAAGTSPILQPVYAIEANGENIIPQAAAVVIAKRLGTEVGKSIVQSTSPKRTAMPGLERLFNRPQFDGDVEPGRNYILLDDTITQGGTFAALERHIVEGGGHVIAVIALTGKRYSATLRATNETIEKLRGAHGDVEPQFQAETGRDFSELTESEARYLANFKPADAVRARIVQGKNRAERSGFEEPGLNAAAIGLARSETVGQRVISLLRPSADGKKAPKP